MASTTDGSIAKQLDDHISNITKRKSEYASHNIKFEMVEGLYGHILDTIMSDHNSFTLSDLMKCYKIMECFRGSRVKEHYMKIYVFLESRINNYFQVVSDLMATNDMNLCYYQKLWGEVDFMSKIIYFIFGVFANTYYTLNCTDTQKYFAFEDMININWRKMVFKCEIDTEKNNVNFGNNNYVNLKKNAIDEILKFRSGMIYNKKSLAIFLHSIGLICPIYENNRRDYRKYIFNDFFNTYEEITKEYFNIESQKMNNLDITEFISVLYNLIQREEQFYRINFNCILKENKLQVSKWIDDIFITQKVPDYIIPQFNGVLEKEDLKVIRQMYSLIIRVDDKTGYNAILQDFENYLEKIIYEKFRENMSTFENKKTFCEFFMEISDKYYMMVYNQFSNDSNFSKVYEKVFKRFVNHNTDQKLKQYLKDTAFSFAKYYHFILSKANKGFNDEVVLKQSTIIIRVLSFVSDLDTFMVAYSAYLAERLLKEEYNDIGVESDIINKLQGNCGYLFGSKCKKMIQDIQNNGNVVELFMNSDHADSTISFKILTNGAWPLTMSMLNHLSNGLVDNVEKKIDDFYKGLYGSRCLAFYRNFCKMTITTTKEMYSKPYTIEISLLQAMFLELFADAKDVITYETVRNVFGGNDLYAMGILKTFVEKSMILTSPKMYEKTDKIIWLTDLDPKMKIKINNKFESKMLKFNISNHGDFISSKQERESLNKILDTERKQRIQAAIVRIMKMRKEEEHNKLVTEIIESQNGRFIVDMGSIKVSMQDLIEKEYIERIPEKKGWYRYLA